MATGEQIPQSAQTNAVLTTAEAFLKKSRAGAQWLYWIVGISIINVVLMQFDVPLRFSVGLGFTELVYAFGQRIGALFVYIGILIDVLFLAVLTLLGVFAGRQKVWAFIGGLAIIALDTALLIGLGAREFMLSIIIHVLAILGLWNGMRASHRYAKQTAEQMMTQEINPSQPNASNARPE